MKLFHSMSRVKTPTVLQMEAVECGAASLGIILGYHGKIIPLEELRITCGISRDGSKASNIVKAGIKYGLISKGFKLEIDELKTLSLPFIVFWNFNHFLVVEGFGKDIVYLNDPAAGPRTVSEEEFDKAFTGIVLTFEPSVEFRKSGEKKSLFASLYQWLNKSKSNLAYIIIATLAITIPGLVIPIFTQIFVDDYLIKQLPGWIGPLLFGMLITAVLRAGLTMLQQNQLLKLQSKLTLVQSTKFFWHVLRLPVVFYQQRFAGDIAQRVDANDRVAQLITGDLAINAANLISIIFYALLMFWYNVILTLIGISFSIINFIVLRIIAKRRKDENLKLLQDRGKLMGITMGGLSTIETIKATGSENDFLIRWLGYNARVINSEQRLEVYTRFLAVMPNFLSILMSVIILGIGGYEVMYGALSVGMLVAFQSLMASFSTPLANLVGLGANLQTVEGDFARIDDILHAPIDPLLTNEPTSQTKPAPLLPKLAGYLELRNITFGYNKLEAPLIENFNLMLKPGARVALVGSTGSGKTTIAKLITGVNHPWSGEILFDGKTRDQIPHEVIVNSLSSVDQDIILFDATVYDNLTLWDETRSEQDVIAAAKAANIHQVIMSRKLGYDSPMGEQGSNFSGGERQRLEIARALTNRPTILIMDEATASLDPLTEKNIDDNIREIGCTCFIVAHRLSTIRDCDEIIVMEQGKIIQRGPHDELIEQGGRYAELIRLEANA